MYYSLFLSTATTVTQKRLNLTLYARCLYCLCLLRGTSWVYINCVNVSLQSINMTFTGGSCPDSLSVYTMLSAFHVNNNSCWQMTNLRVVLPKKAVWMVSPAAHTSSQWSNFFATRLLITASRKWEQQGGIPGQRLHVWFLPWAWAEFTSLAVQGSH